MTPIPVPDPPVFRNPRPPTRAPDYEPPPDFLEAQPRFFDHVARSSTNLYEDEDWFDRCQLWTKPLTADGQGYFYVRGLRIPIHRFAYRLAIGPVPKDRVARPICGEALCVNWRHLLLRPRRGGNQRLDAKLVDDIRWCFNHGTRASRLAEIFGVGVRHINRIVKDLPR